MDNAEDENDDGGSQVSPAELAQSYLAFVRRALRGRWSWVIATFVVGLGLTLAVTIYFPRTYTCETVLMGEGNKVLEGYEGPISLAGADALIMRHDNLEALIDATDLVRKRDERRPPLLRLKDRVTAAVLGPPRPEYMRDAMVGTLESRMGVEVKGNILNIAVDWNDPNTAAELAEAARESFVKSRHNAEISAFQEKMAILEGHAGTIRKEIEDLAKQIQTLAEEKVAEAERRASGKVKDDKAKDVPIFRAQPRPAVASANPALQAQLAEKQRKLTELEGERESRLRTEQTKLNELMLRLTPSHPEVVQAQQRLALLSQPSSEVLLLRAEVKTLTADVEQQASVDALKPARGGRAGSSAAVLEALPTEIIALLDDEVDPALQEQLHGAVMKFGAIRQELRSARIQLDTAQAAFAHRYKIVVPADPPATPRKPKVAMLIFGGLATSLLFAFLFPIVAELRRGVISEQWQVHQLQLPVLADLRLPPRAGD